MPTFLTIKWRVSSGNLAARGMVFYTLITWRKAEKKVSFWHTWHSVGARDLYRN